MLGEARLAAVVPISDRQGAIDFYTGTLGLKEIEGVGFDAVFEAGGGALLGAYVTDYAGQAGHTLAGFMVEEYDLPHLKTVDGIAEIEGERGAWFKDPDGNILAIGEPAG